MDSYGTVNSKMRELEKQQAFSVLMRKVYTWMTMALVITGICAYGVANSPALLQIIYSTPMAMIVLCIAEVGLVFWL